jgi:hypothetical protein
MPTNDRKVNIYNKRLLSLTALKNEFLDYLQNAVNEIGSSFFADQSGTLDNQKIGLNNGHGGSTFDIDVTNAHKVLAGNHTIDLNVITGAGKTHTIPFENTSGPYYAGVYFAEVEDGIEINPRTGDPEYKSLKQTFGNVATPTSVIDNTTYIRININSITESGVNHSGRTVRVWMVDPVSPSEAIAFFEGTSAYSAPNNYVDIPYSGANGPLGQDTSSQPPSTTAADYEVFIEGVTWRKNTDLRLETTCAFLGIITAGTPPTFNIDDQILLQIVSLDRAYDGLGGLGNGRQIYSDAGAVEIITGSLGTTDEHKASLIINRMDNTSYFQVALEILAGDSKTVPLCIVQEWTAIKDKTVNVSGDTVTFSGVNPSTSELDVDLMWLWIKTGTANGIYAMTPSMGATTIQCRDIITGASPAWGAETGLTASILIPRFVFANKDASNYRLDHLQGLLLTGCDGAGNSTEMLRLVPYKGSGQLLSIKNNYKDSAGNITPQDLAWIEFDSASVNNPGAVLKLGKWIGTIGSDTAVHGRMGIDFRPHIHTAGDADKYALNVKPLSSSDPINTVQLSSRAVGLHDRYQTEIMRWTPAGRMADTHRFRDDFMYKDGWTNPHGESWYVRSINNGGTWCVNKKNFSGGQDLYSQGGIIHLETAGVGLADGLCFEGPANWIVRTSDAIPITRALNLYCRFRPLDTNTDVNYYVGFMTDGPPFSVETISMELDGALHDWELHSYVSGSDRYAASGPAFGTGYPWDRNHGWLSLYMRINPLSNGYCFCDMYNETSDTWGHGAIDMSGDITDWIDKRVMPFFLVQQSATTTVMKMEVDLIEVWDDLIVAGAKE